MKRLGEEKKRYQVGTVLMGGAGFMVDKFWGLTKSDDADSEVALVAQLEQALDALESMFWQYCRWEGETPDGRPKYYHMCMSAGEEAEEALLSADRISKDQSAEHSVGGEYGAGGEQ